MNIKLTSLKRMILLIFIVVSQIGLIEINYQTKAQGVDTILCDTSFNAMNESLPDDFSGAYYTVVENYDTGSSLQIRRYTANNEQLLTFPITMQASQTLRFPTMSPDGEVFVFRFYVNQALSEIVVWDSITDEVQTLALTQGEIEFFWHWFDLNEVSSKHIVWTDENNLILQQFDDSSIRVIQQQELLISRDPLQITRGNLTSITYPVLEGDNNLYTYLSPDNTYYTVQSVQQVPELSTLGEQYNIYDATSLSPVFTLQSSDQGALTRTLQWSPTENAFFAYADERNTQDRIRGGVVVVDVENQFNTDYAFYDRLQVLLGVDTSIQDRWAGTWRSDGRMFAVRAYSSLYNGYYIVAYDLLSDSITAICDTNELASRDMLQSFWSPDNNYVGYWDFGEVYVFNIVSGATYRFPNPVNDFFVGWVNYNTQSCDSTISASDISSLISAINTGNNVAAPYSICLADSVYTLNAVDNSDSIGANALPVITGDISIIGNGATLERDVSAPDFRFLRVENGATLTLENLTLNNGHTSGTSDAGDGGAIYNDGTLTLDSVILTNNTANIEAGAIYNNDAQILTITNSSFTGNHALGDDGGAIDNHGTATISSTTFADNHADSDDGGAIWNDDNAILTISDSIFSLNTAFDEGGIIMNFGTISLTNNIIANNSSGDDGGAISSDSGSITVTNGNFSNNISGDDGGAIMTYAPLNLSGVTLDGNQSSDKGGAIYVWDSDLQIDNSTLSNNISLNNGGAIYIGNASLASNLLNSCVFGNTAGNTSGVFAENDNFDATSTWWGAIDGPGGSGTGSGMKSIPM